MAVSIFDGYSSVFDSELLSVLQYVTSDSGGAFLIDSFKSLTRNIEKLLTVMEFLLSRGLCFVTTNFYIENGHVERRLKILRAAHTVVEMKNNLKQYYMLGPKHKAVLKQVAEQSEAELPSQ